MNIDRLFARTAIAVLVLTAFAVVKTASAQSATRVTPCSATTANNELCLTWGAVTGGTNGEALTGVSYRVTQKFGSGSFTTVQSASTGLQYYAKALAPGSYTFVVYANCTNTGCVESNASNAATGAATVVPVQPNAPVIIIGATIKLGQPPVYRILKTLTLNDGEVVFVAPASSKALFVSN